MTPTMISGQPANRAKTIPEMLVTKERTTFTIVFVNFLFVSDPDLFDQIF